MKSEEKDALIEKVEGKELASDKNVMKIENEIKQLPNDIGWEEEDDL